MKDSSVIIVKTLKTESATEIAVLICQLYQFTLLSAGTVGFLLCHYGPSGLARVYV